MGSRYHQICLCQSPQEEGDLELGLALDFFVNCALFSLLCPEGIPGEQEVTNSDSSQGHRDQIALAQVGVNFQSPCPSHSALHFYCSWKDVGSWQE